ncbi:hypothetical protein ACFFX0_20145 [Citricoccus parietis]|uniref:Uncharacterized protein n=1 Tax=Citricoccus parietis TaxID=592307 RepID=A0ABV5G372_9MICC
MLDGLGYPLVRRCRTGLGHEEPPQFWIGMTKLTYAKGLPGVNFSQRKTAPFGAAWNPRS